ncbi:MAG: hypothetical protein TREMPRED_005566 [Tremellales sp. Tagirdzhanova-0007]|nr:MAG: hypothetical protein TREMPRED_005566 [Tremellales sp. Tagirdzhanova-0007]
MLDGSRARKGREVEYFQFHGSRGPLLMVLCQQHGIADPETLSQVEEMLLSLVHIQLQVWRVAGQQNKYAGQTCQSSRDNGALLSRPPFTSLRT